MAGAFDSVLDCQSMTRERHSHWDAVKRAFEEDANQRNLDAAKLTAEQRVRMGLRMGGKVAGTWPDEPRELERQAIAKAGLHARWRELQAARGAQS